MSRWLLKSMTELSSRKWISVCTGRLAQSGLSRRFIPRFVKLYGIRAEEAEKPLSDYATLNEFFTRRLREGAREIDGAADTLVSPVDALITGAGPVQAGTVLNVKGQNYTVEELLNRSPRMDNYRHGFCLVLYLSPTDYHRIHAPITGQIVEKEHIPGKVYPVNDFGLRHMPRVLSRNERLVTYIRHQGGELAVVKVGAMNVSSIQYVDPEQRETVKGGELAYFEFGSTVVLLTASGTFDLRGDLMPGKRVRMGESLGRLHRR
ncbi:phosphatidylserine decarboxylase [Paenibacillus sp. IB182496]|uniref:phosphatidylserine decarboxylase n=1 Tax=Paenibacillus sabuli TaxID=2772509 RepID=A0A927BXI6_9BACL|nr:archaetidylserine decarboxylase [Paenibacillus sabuli]MBD2848182.1 phosphatidylserine decarboxylase [Paenibacillus sabuli]